MTTAVHQSIPLPLLRASSTNPRKHFDPAALKELAASLEEHGVLQPILVRPLGNLDGHASHDCFEIVAGERRYRAAKIAKLPEIPATVRELTDKQVVEIQVIENVQREDLHPLEEAEGYEQLIKHHGYDVKGIAAKVGKSDSYVAKRLKLCALGPGPRSAFTHDKIDLQKAFLLARIPHLDIQTKAFAAITRFEMGAQRAAEIIHQNFMLRLAEAPFDTKDAALCPAAGACIACPKRTGASPELFPDVKKDDLCTDSKCFDAKRAAHRAHAVADAKAKGWTILTYAVADVKKILKEKYPKLLQVRRDTHQDNYRAQQTAKEKKAKAERAIRVKILEAVRAKVGASEFDRADLVMIAESFYERALFEGQTRIATLWGWAEKRSDVRECKKRISALSVPELRRLLADIALIGDTEVHSYSVSPPTALLAAAKRYKVDAEKIRREATAAAKAKPKAKAKGKK